MGIQKLHLRETHGLFLIFGNSPNLMWPVLTRDAFITPRNHIITGPSQQTNPRLCLSGECGHWSTTRIKIWDRWNGLISCFSASEIQMMTLPPGQFVITDSGVATPVTTGQVKAVTPVSRAAREGFPVHPTAPICPPLPSPQLPTSEWEAPPLCAHNNSRSYIISLIAVYFNYWLTVCLFPVDDEFLESWVILSLSLYSQCLA